jgi:Phage tail tube protein, GTA-gp10
VSGQANAARGEAEIAGHLIRPSFAALVAAEEELGPLFALVERAAAGELKLSEMVALFWHCLADRSAVERAELSETIAQGGLAAATPVLKVLLGQILGGR